MLGEKRSRNESIHFTRCKNVDFLKEENGRGRSFSNPEQRGQPRDES